MNYDACLNEDIYKYIVMINTRMYITDLGYNAQVTKEGEVGVVLINTGHFKLHFIGLHILW